jgi:hypothetical protein
MLSLWETHSMTKSSEKMGAHSLQITTFDLANVLSMWLEQEGFPHKRHGLRFFVLRMR